MAPRSPGAHGDSYCKGFSATMVHMVHNPAVMQPPSSPDRHKLGTIHLRAPSMAFHVIYAWCYEPRVSRIETTYTSVPLSGYIAYGAIS